MKEDRLLIVTEANERVASGHLFECIECVKYMTEQGMRVTLMVNQDMPEHLKQRIGEDFVTYQSDIQNEWEFIIDYLRQNPYEQILFNLREIRNDFLKKIKEQVDVQIICVDEFGNRRLDADIIVNPMIDESYWNYETDAELYCGSEYLVLPLSLQAYHDMQRTASESIRTVTVSMGGVDIGNSTIKLAEWLPRLDEALEINLVLGGGYGKEDKVREMVEGHPQIRVFRNISYLSRLFFESDLAVCAGGNTLHELAVIGTPAIVIPSMPHEMRNGKAYEGKGFGFCGSMASRFTFEELEKLYQKIADKNVRNRMSSQGRLLGDGRGYERMYEIIRGKQ